MHILATILLLLLSPVYLFVLLQMRSVILSNKRTRELLVSICSSVRSLTLLFISLKWCLSDFGGKEQIWGQQPPDPPLLCVQERILFKIAVMIFRALNGAPAYLSPYFIRVTHVPSRHRLRSASSNQLAVPPFNLSAVGKQGFPVSGANFWNSLPSHVTSAPSLAICRQRLKIFLFHLSYPDFTFCFAPCFIVDLAIIFVI